jgi:hypothetical protein
MAECAALSAFTRSLQTHTLLSADSSSAALPSLRALDSGGALAALARTAATACGGAAGCGVESGGPCGAARALGRGTGAGAGADGDAGGDAELARGQRAFAHAFSAWAAGGDGGVTQEILVGRGADGVAGRTDGGNVAAASGRPARGGRGAGAQVWRAARGRGRGRARGRGRGAHAAADEDGDDGRGADGGDDNEDDEIDMEEFDAMFSAADCAVPKPVSGIEDNVTSCNEGGGSELRPISRTGEW